MIYERITITVDESTWPQKNELIHWEYMSALFNIERVDDHLEWWWLKPIYHVWTDRDIMNAYNAGYNDGREVETGGAIMHKDEHDYLNVTKLLK